MLDLITFAVRAMDQAGMVHPIGYDTASSLAHFESYHEFDSPSIPRWFAYNMQHTDGKVPSRSTARQAMRDNRPELGNENVSQGGVENVREYLGLAPDDPRLARCLQELETEDQECRQIADQSQKRAAFEERIGGPSQKHEVIRDSQDDDMASDEGEGPVTPGPAAPTDEAPIPPATVIQADEPLGPSASADAPQASDGVDVEMPDTHSKATECPADTGMEVPEARVHPTAPEPPSDVGMASHQEEDIVGTLSAQTAQVNISRPAEGNTHTTKKASKSSKRKRATGDLPRRTKRATRSTTTTGKDPSPSRDDQEDENALADDV